MSGWTVPELMAVELSRHISDGDVAIMGAVSALPMAACRLAQRTHAPGSWFVGGGSGAVDPRLEGIPPSSCDERLLDAACVMPLPEVVMLEGRGDVFDVFFAGGLQIDAYGNTNLERIGQASRPRLKGPGGVGLPFLPLAGRVVLYTMSHDVRTFVEKVDFVSGPARSVTGRGPELIVTPLCTMDFDSHSRRARLRTVHHGVTLEQVQAATGFELEVSAAVPDTTAPSEHELAILREIDSSGLLRQVA